MTESAQWGRFSENHKGYKKCAVVCFCLDGEVVFINSKHVNKIGSSTLIVVVTCGQLKDCLMGVIYSVNPEFAPSDSKNECNRI